ncbi:hypothetical protein Ocin01_00796 [Orchesella cincta]|uniref:Uncharacterized protein n=1 Tax=Orchesella cincta TaxID=48709 RepID=A0A1D2NLG9_ORCCI|nr:hypothetical protein Ocin01_00796 [Orchesella cincta]
MYSQKEDPPLTASESELPDMVPVSIRTSLPELQHYVMEKVLAGLLLTWDEFLKLFDIRLNPNEYFIRGANGSKSDLNQKIGDYVNSLKRKMKTYPVTLERVNGTNEVNSKAHEVVNSKNSVPSFLENDDEAQSSGVQRNESKNVSSASTSKKFKLLDGDKRRRNNRKPKESLEKIAQAVVHSASLKFSNPVNANRVDTHRNLDARSPSPIKDIDRTEDRSNDRASTPSDSVEPATNNKVQPSGQKLKRLSIDRRHSKELASSSGSVKKPRKPRQKSRPVARRSTNDTDSSKESTESEEDEGPPTKAKKKVLKQMVLQYLAEKVSARSMLRLRSELMGLREQEKYFKVTSVVPMTAGMMEQTFCRKLHE